MRLSWVHTNLLAFYLLVHRVSLAYVWKMDCYEMHYLQTIWLSFDDLFLHYKVQHLWLFDHTNATLKKKKLSGTKKENWHIFLILTSENMLKQKKVVTKLGDISMYNALTLTGEKKKKKKNQMSINKYKTAFTLRFLQWYHYVQYFIICQTLWFCDRNIGHPKGGFMFYIIFIVKDPRAARCYLFCDGQNM